MDWMNRNGQQTQAAGQPPAPVGPSTGKRRRGTGPLQLSSVALLFTVTALVAVVVFFLAFNNSGSSSSQSAVDKDKMQAVFLNGGQVYFGKIKDLSSQSLKMEDIYYLRVNQTVQPNQQNAQSNNDISLVKLGCELHGPEDAMVINQEQVIFWENLKTDGQVAKAVETYKKQNPNGQKCDTQTGGTSNTPQNSVSPTNNTTTPTPNNRQ